MTRKIIQAKKTTLTYSISDSATTIQLANLLKLDGTAFTASDLGDSISATIDPGTSKEEIIVIDGANVTVESDGKVTITSVSRGRNDASTYGSGGFATDHGAGAVVIFSNNPQLYNALGFKANNEVLTGYWEAPDPITAQGLVTRDYMLALINGGTISVNQVIEAGIAGETVSAGNLLYFSETDNEWLKTDADTLATLFNVKLGIAMGSGSNGNVISGGVLTRGSYTTSGLTQGDLVYASNTAGAFTSGTAGTVPRVIGIAKDTTTLYFDPDFQNQLYNYAVDAVGTDSYAVTMPGALSVPFVGLELNVKVGTANTGACTLAINGGSAKSIVKGASDELNTGDLLANQIIKVVYDGTNWQIVSKTNTIVPSVTKYTSASSTTGASTTRFDITNPSGTTFRYTYDSTGNDPNFSLANNPIGSLIVFNCDNFSAANNGFFVVTGAGANYVEVTNASGVVESDKTIGSTGYIQVSGVSTWTKPAGLKYAVIEVQAAGGGGGGANADGSGGFYSVGQGGGGGGYSKKTVQASSLNSSEYYLVGHGGAGGSGGAVGIKGGYSAFGAHCYATGGAGGGHSCPNTLIGNGGLGVNGDVNFYGETGSVGIGCYTTAGITSKGGNSILGAGAPEYNNGGATSTTGANGSVYGGGGGGGLSVYSGGAQSGGTGAAGIVIITEYY